MTWSDPLAAGPVRLRRLAMAEVPAVVAYRRLPEVARYQGWGVVDPGEIERDLQAMTAREPCDAPGPWFQLAIERAADGALVGDLGVRLVDAASAEIGYTIAPAHQRQGLATAAVDGICHWLLGPRRLARVIAVMEGQNTASLRVAERAGFTRISCIETRHRGEPGLLLTYERR
ncbi:MAG: GNAT family N-acetyltransferase [Kofleriaceae bacterium]|nr:GNAT family N-acetyltransferase [Kofleriaceae bacterium]MCL4227659.1 GNAT family N-acetyltransferase [Myxococcales bacterium]